MKRQDLIALAVVLASAACIDSETEDTESPITNGTPVDATQRPWAAFLSIKIPNGATLSCSGTLIAPDKVLTAAHCAVCATSIDVGLIGHQSQGQAPGTAPPATIHVAKSGIHYNPAAYPDLPTCDSSNTDIVFQSLNSKTVWGADVAILDLPAPVSITPKPALLMPPYGFSPTQDLYGQNVTLIGRGKPSPDSSDLSIMREGQSSVDAYARVGGVGCSGSIELNEPFAIQLENDGGGESMIQGGDSGGPMIASVSSGSYVVGVNSASKAPDLASFIAPTFVLPNSAFLSFHGAGSTAINDGDGDGVIDGRDNCPSDANTDQIDLDNDGVGDVCDNCSPLVGVFDISAELSRYDGTPSSVYSDLHNPDQKNSNSEAEDEQLLLSHPSYLQGGAVQPIDESEYLSMYKKIFGIPCNGATETQIKHMAEFRRGDVCDAVPSPTAEIVYSTVDETEVSQAPLAICQANGWGFATCKYQVPVGFEVTPILGDGSGPLAGVAGVRFCECAQAHDSESARRLNCGAGSVADCAIDGTRYTSSDPAWKQLQANETNATYNDEGVAAKPFIAWDFYSDLASLSGTPLSFPLDINLDGSIVGMPPVDGVMWFHTPTLGGISIADVVGDGIREPQQMASTYFNGDFRIKVSSTWHEFPEYRPPWPWEYCAVCGVLDFPWLWVLDEHLAISVNEKLTVFDVTNELERTAMELLGSSGQRILASEQEFRLVAAGISKREIVVASATDATPLGSISIEGGEIFGNVFAAQGRRREKTDARVMAYSATRDELFDLSVAAGSRTAKLASFTEEGSWSPMPLAGDSIYSPLSMTYRLEDSSLYVIDREPEGRLRLLAIQTDSLRVTLVSRDLGVRESREVDASITGDRRGGLLVALAGEQTQLAHLANDRGKWLAVDRAKHERPFVGEVRELGGGVYFVTGGKEEYSPERLEPRAFEEGSEEIEPLF